MADVSLNAIVGGSVVIKKSVVIDSSQTWTAPANLAGNTVWLTGCAAGGSGSQRSTGVSTGGYGGNYCVKMPVIVTPSAGYLVTIPAGGAGVTTGDGNSGGDLSFGSLLTLKGGSGGINPNGDSQYAVASYFSRFGVKPALIFPSSDSLVGGQTNPAESLNGNICGATETNTVSNYISIGGAAGFFGNGGAAGSNGVSAAANSGAGGGAARGVSGTSGAGGSGRLIIEWEEYL